MDTTKLRPGRLVTVRAFGGKELSRRIVFVRGSVVAVCCEEEYQEAKKQGRDPSCIGFKLSDVISSPPMQDIQEYGKYRFAGNEA